MQRASDSLIYDAENRLIQVKKGETVLATFVYNGDGERVKSILDGYGLREKWLIAPGSGMDLSC